MPERFCALNLALYRTDGEAWVFTEPGPGRVARTADSFGLGRSALSWVGDRLQIEVNERTAPFGQPVRGRIVLHPVVVSSQPLPLDPDQSHGWWPVAPRARVEVRLEDPQLSFTGSGYHDANFGDEALEEGFVSWSWSRAELPETTAVLYDVQPRAGSAIDRALTFDRSGRIDLLEVPRRRRLEPTRWGLERPTRTDADGDAVVLRTLEDTPFYSRSLIQTSLTGHRVAAMHESLSLSRFSHPLVQLMLPFRIRRGS